MLKDERSGAHAEEFRKCGKSGDLPSVSGTPESSHIARLRRRVDECCKLWGRTGS